MKRREPEHVSETALSPKAAPTETGSPRARSQTAISQTAASQTATSPIASPSPPRQPPSKPPLSSLSPLSPTVIALGLVSFFTDLSSEMIYPLLPVFLSSVLGAGAFALGLIEGIAETTASILKIVSGYLTDRAGGRKPFVLIGYGLSSTVRPLIGLAMVWPAVLVLRFMDRVGKGIRTSPRDALIAEVTPPGCRGRAYGFHRAMDHAGAVFGPLAAVLLIQRFGFSLRSVFLCSAIPAVAVMVILALFVREGKQEGKVTGDSPLVQKGMSGGRVSCDNPAAAGGEAAAEGRGTDQHQAVVQSARHVAKHVARQAAGESAGESAEQSAEQSAGQSGTDQKGMGGDFRLFLLAVIIFTLGNSTDAFLLLRLNAAGVGAAGTATLWSLFHVVKMASTYAGGRLSDRTGQKSMIITGWAYYAFIYLLFAFLHSQRALIGVFLLYGAYFGLTEPAERAWVSSFAPQAGRGRAFGSYHGAIGLASLPASLIFGLVWQTWGYRYAFIMGGIFALLGCVLIREASAPSTDACRA
ncbi:MAG: MFS transporter [bacterium]